MEIPQLGPFDLNERRKKRQRKIWDRATQTAIVLILAGLVFMFVYGLVAIARHAG